MQDELHPLDDALGEGQVGQVSLEKLHVRHVIQVRELAGGQRVSHPDLVTAPYEFFRQMRTDETCATRDQELGHEPPSRC